MGSRELEARQGQWEAEVAAMAERLRAAEADRDEPGGRPRTPRRMHPCTTTADLQPSSHIPVWSAGGGRGSTPRVSAPVSEYHSPLSRQGWLLQMAELLLSSSLSKLLKVLLLF